MKKRLPPIVLFFLAPVIGELLSGSAPPAEFFTPFGLIVLTMLYGGGAILARELTIRWNKGWLTLILLGAAYGIIEEGLMVKSFFDPAWVDIGILGSYGRWAGINWVWSMELIIYHAVISILIPIRLTEMIFPHRRGDSWVSWKAFSVILLLFLADVWFGYRYLTTYRPPAGIYFLAVMATIGLVIIARLVPQQPLRAKEKTVGNPFRFWLTGFVSILLFFFTFWILPNTGMPVIVLVIIGLAVVIFSARQVLRMSGNAYAWDDIHKLALISGVLSFFILLAPLSEFVMERKDNPAGMTLVGITAAFLLFLLFRKIKKTKHTPMGYN